MTRDALWDALYHRRTVATTGAQRIHLAFRMDGEWQGSLLALDTLPHFTIDAEGTAPITRVELIENGEVVQTWPGTGNRIVVNERLSRVPERPDNYYYVRLLQADGNLAWSSPIWVSYLPELPEARGYLYWLPRVEVRFEVAREVTPGPRPVVSLWLPQRRPGEAARLRGLSRCLGYSGPGAARLVLPCGSGPRTGDP